MSQCRTKRRGHQEGMSGGEILKFDGEELLSLAAQERVQQRVNRVNDRGGYRVVREHGVGGKVVFVDGGVRKRRRRRRKLGTT